MTTDHRRRGRRKNVQIAVDLERMSRGDKTRIQLAANSIASGDPSSLRHGAFTACTSSPRSSYPGITIPARSRNSRVASLRSASRSTRHSGRGGPQRRDRIGHLQPGVQRYPAGRHDDEVGTRPQQLAEHPCAVGSDLLTVVQHQQSRLSVQGVAQAPATRTFRSAGTPTRELTPGPRHPTPTPGRPSESAEPRFDARSS